MDLEIPAGSGKPMRWPSDKENMPGWLQFHQHAHSHSTPEHHYRGDETCDEACRRGLRVHRHKIPRGLNELAAEQIRPADYSALVEATQGVQHEDMRVVLHDLRNPVMPEEEGH